MYPTSEENWRATSSLPMWRCRLHKAGRDVADLPYRSMARHLEIEKHEDCPVLPGAQRRRLGRQHTRRAT